MGYLDPEKQRAAQAAWYQSVVRQRRTDWLAKNGPCRKCGSSDRLEVDHINPADKVSHAVWTWSDERRAAELAKCQVLCKPCHLRKTVAENLANPDNPVGQNWRKTHCDRGHPFDLFNTYFRNGWRECRTCHNEKRCRQRRERKAA
jgi:5-methylcytosine-specific restriction endonuclease McrA